MRILHSRSTSTWFVPVACALIATALSSTLVLAVPDIVFVGYITAESTVTVTTDGETTQHPLPVPSTASGDGVIHLDVDGDYGNSSEIAELWIEGDLIGSVGDAVGDCLPLSDSWVLPLALLSVYAADGVIDVSVDNSLQVNPICALNYHSVTLEFPTSGSSQDFGDVAVGDSLDRIVEFRNAGNSPLSISAITSDLPEFTASPGAALVLPEESVEVTLTFTPTSDTLYEGTLTVFSDDPDQAELAVDLVGTGIFLPSIEVDPTFFDLTLVLGASTVEVMTLSNGGLGELNYTITSLSPWLTTDPSGGVVAAAGAADIDLFIDSSGLPLGLHTGALQIDSNDPDTPQSIVTVQMTVLPSIAVNPTSFNETVTQGQSTTVLMTLSNLGQTELNYSITPSAAWLSTSPISGSLPVGEFSDVDVTMDAGALSAGAHSGTLQIDSNNGSTLTLFVNVLLTVLPIPDIDVDPTLLDFGNVEIGANPLKFVNVRNLGGSVLHVTSVVSDAVEFSPSPQSFTVVAGGNQLIEVTFTPSHVGDFSGTLTITSDDPNEALVTVSMIGEGVPPPVVEVLPLSFDTSVAAGEVLVESLTVSNSGIGTLDFDIASDVPWMTLTPVSGTVPPSDSMIVNVEFSARDLSPGVYNGLLTLDSNDPQTPIVAVPAQLTVVLLQDINVGHAVTLTSVQTYTSAGATTEHAFTIGSPPNEGGALELIADGNYGGPTETALLLAEGLNLGTVGSSGFGCGPATGVFPFNEVDLASLVVDGVVQATVSNSNDVGAICPVNSHTLHLRYIAQAAGLNFGNVPLGATKELTLDVENSGTLPLQVGPITSDHADYTVSPGSFSLDPGAVGSVTVTLQPTSISLITGILAIPSDDPDEPLVSVTLTGNGSQGGTLAVAPSSLDSTLHSGEQEARTLTLSNTGVADLEFSISSAWATAPVTATAVFLNFEPYRGTVPPSGSVDVEVFFTSVGHPAGLHEAEILVGNSDPLNPVVAVPATMTVTPAPHIQVAGQLLLLESEVDYDTAGARTSHPLTGAGPSVGSGLVILEATGNYQAPDRTATLLGEGFALGDVGNSGLDCGPSFDGIPVQIDRLAGMAGNGIFRFDVQNSPAVQADCPINRHKLRLYYWPEIQVLGFGLVDLGEQKTLQIRIENNGTELLDISSISIDAPEFTLSHSSANLQPSAILTLEVTLTPPAELNYNGTLEIASNDPDHPLLQIPVSGGGFCPDEDGDGVSTCAGDCDDLKPFCTFDCTDQDGDLYCITFDCDDNVNTCGLDCTDADGDGVAACAGDCDDANPYCAVDCTDTDGDGICPPFDCDDGNAFCDFDCTDADSDGYCVTTDCDETNPNCTGDCSDADLDGLRACDGDCDDANANCTTDCTDADLDDYCVTSDCYDLNPNCTTDCTDADEDGYCVTSDCDETNANCTTDCTDADGDGFCVTSDCDDANPNCLDDCFDQDGDGYCAGTDCDDTNPNCSADCTDGDHDGVCVIEDCDDGNVHCSTDCTDTDADGYCVTTDCDEANPNCTSDCTDADSDGYCVTTDCDETNPNCTSDCTDADSDGYCVTTDCDETNPNCLDDCTDADDDGYCVTTDCDDGNPNCLGNCTDADGDGYCADTDCDDTSPNCTVDCTDADSDGYCHLTDCDETNPNCTTDCTDADVDGYCVTTDCDDSTFSCTTDCTDADADGVRLCDGDCDDEKPFCTTDCTDADDDGYCLPLDCDESNPICSLDCTDADADGYCADTDCDETSPTCTLDCTDDDLDGYCIDTDCNDEKPNCTTDCTDFDDDGYCVTTDCDDSAPHCALDCTDVDDDGFCTDVDCDDSDPDCTNDCDDADMDGYRICDGDCNDEDPSSYTGGIEICTDSSDNDCDGLVDEQDESCAGLLAAHLHFDPADKANIVWDAASGADWYALYRGDIPETGLDGYRHLCEAAQVAGTTAQDPDLPPPGEGFYYLVTGQFVDAADGDRWVGGPLGRASDNTSRPDSTTIACGPRVYVDPDLTIENADGLTWATAYTGVGSAIHHPEAPERGVEVWARGDLVNPAGLLTPSYRAGLRVLGGFAGNEVASWERDPAANPTSWAVSQSTALIWVQGASLVLDGLTLGSSNSAVLSAPAGALTEFTDLRFVQQTGWSVDLVTASDSRLVVDRCDFDASGSGGLRAIAGAGVLSGRVRRNSFAGGSDAALRLEARPGSASSAVELDVVGNSVIGGASGIVLGAHVADLPLDAIQTSFVASNLVHGTSGSPFVVEAGGTFVAASAAASAVAEPLVIGNTLSDGGAAGLVVAATRSDVTGNEQNHIVRAAPQIWDNLITFNAGAGIAESTDDETSGLSADPAAIVGNDLHGNASFYRDEGTTDLFFMDGVNLLTGAGDNFDEPPGYVDRPNGDYHLTLGTVLGVGSSMRHLANLSDPGLALTWTAPSFDDSSWERAVYGVGYDDGPPPNADALLATVVPSGAYSVFTRATFTVDDVGQIVGLKFGADYDDGCVAWVNGVEVFRSASMPAGDPGWDTVSSLHESSNGDEPSFELHDVSAASLVNGVNVLAIGVWNNSPTSDDLVLVPLLILNEEVAPVDAGHIDAPRLANEDIDGEARVEDGDRDGIARPDVGADER